MAQITHGIRSFLSFPLVYHSFQYLMGAHKGRQNFVKNYIKPFPGMKILDIGCGTADILDYLSDVEYWGYDINESYINFAKEKFKKSGHFNYKQLQFDDLTSLPKFDAVLALGLFHHLDDSQAIGVFQLAHQALTSNGRLLTVDPCIVPNQNPIARFLIRNDRGQNVRDERGYQNLAAKIFSSLHVDVRHQAWIPYTHCFLECKK